MSENNNPANDKVSLPKDFIPMTSATLRLEVPKKDGFHRHWFRGTPERIGRAQQAGYRFCDANEVRTNSFDLGGDAKAGGNTDLGSRVSIISGDDIDHSGQPGRLYLMECPNEYFEAGQKILNDKNEGVAEALRGGLIGSDNDTTEGDTKSRYVKGKVPDLFNPHKTRRS